MRIEQTHQRAERYFVRLSLGILLGIILLVAICWGGHDLYVRWQERRLVRLATYDLEHGDERGASLAARAILELKPSSAGAARILAQLAERAGDRSALDWRRRVAQVQPESTEEVLAWARSALQFNDVAQAERIGSRVSESGKKTAGYHAVMALIAQARHHEDQAEAEWSEAIRLVPAEKAYQLQLGLIQLHSKDPQRHASGVATLSALREEPSQRLLATRALINDGLGRRENAAKLLELARDLQAYREAVPSDRLLYLTFLRQLDDPQFIPYLTEMEKSVAAKPADLATLISWMSRSNLNLLALDFIKTLSPESLQNWPLPLAVADIYVRLRDWKKMETLTKQANWRQFEFLRHAYLTRALRGQDKSAAAEHEWAAAVKAASAQSDSALALVRIVSEWGWDSESVELLWALAKYPEKQREAFQTLYRYYTRTGDTQGLYRVLVRLSELDAGNLDVQNNLAQVALLLNANPDEARRMAADIYHKRTTNPAYATTYAYSLLSKGDTKGALKVMSALSEEQLQDPSIAAYYGIFLASAKDARAREFLETGYRAPLLPEEKALLDKALASVDSGHKAQ